MPPRPQTRHPGLTVVATVSGMLRAEILKSKLEQADIPVVLDYESAGLLFGITASGLPLGQVRLLVANQDATDAKAILQVDPSSGWEEQVPPVPPNP